MHYRVLPVDQEPLFRKSQPTGVVFWYATSQAYIPFQYAGCSTGPTMNGRKIARKSCFLLSVILIIVALKRFYFKNGSYVTNLKSSNSSPENEEPTVVKLPIKSSRYGYLLATSFLDEMTGSQGNLLSLQCWAGSLGRGVRVVEPFIVSTIYGLDLYDISNVSTSESGKNSVKLGDVYDLMKWENFTSKKHFAPLSSWDSFIKNAPRKLILIDRDCIDWNDSFRICKECIVGLDSKNFSHSSVIFARTFGFEIVRKSCIPGKVHSQINFTRFIYGGYDPREVVVLFHSWGGVMQVEPSIRAGVQMSRCNRQNLYLVLMPLSSTIIQDGKKYIQKYIPNAATEGYISLMVRVAFISIRHSHFKGWSVKQINVVLEHCFNAIRKDIDLFKSKHKLKSMYLTMDAMKQGANFYYRNDDTKVVNAVAEGAHTLYQSLLGINSSDLDHSYKLWDNSFESIASFNSAGYISMLQKHLAAQGTCLLTAGGGEFQRSARNMYRDHRKCTHVVKECEIFYKKPPSV